MIARKIGRWIVPAVLCFSAASFAADDRPEAVENGWDKPYGLLFNLQNIFTNGAILSGEGGGIGAQYNLNATTGIRAIVNLSKTSNPAYETTSASTVTTSSGTTTTTTNSFVVPGPTTSTLGLGLTLEYIKRISTGALSPYLGAGVSFVFNNSQLAYVDNVSVANVTTTVNNSVNTFGFGLSGLLGVDWRINKYFSLFAEYSLGIVPFSQSSVSAETTVVDSTANTTTDSKVSGSQSHVLDFSTALSQGAALGVIAHF